MSIIRKNARYATIAALALALSVASPKPASAQLSIAVADAGNALAKELGDMFDSAEKMVYAQFHANVADNAAHTGAQLPLAAGYAVSHPELSKVCATVQGQSASLGMHQAVQAMAGSASNIAQQTTGVPQGTQLAMADKNGNLDPNEDPALCKNTSDNCANFDATRRDADITYASTFKEDVMQVPAMLALKSGQMQKLDATQAKSMQEKEFIDALNACYNARAQDPISFAGQPNNGATASNNTAISPVAVIGTQGQRHDKDLESAGIYPCVDQVYRNSAIGSATASALGGSFQSTYNLEQNWCKELVQKGITDDVVNNCTTNGISFNHYQSLKKNRFGFANYVTNYLPGQDLTKQQIAILMAEHDDFALLAEKLDGMQSSLTAQATTSLASLGSGRGLNPADVTVTMLEQQKQFADQQKVFLEEQRKQFSEMNGLLRALVDQNQAIIANQRKVQEAKATEVPSYQPKVTDIKSP